MSTFYFFRGEINGHKILMGTNKGTNIVVTKIGKVLREVNATTRDSIFSPNPNLYKLYWPFPVKNRTLPVEDINSNKTHLSLELP